MKHLVRNLFLSALCFLSLSSLSACTERTAPEPSPSLGKGGKAAQADTAVGGTVSGTNNTRVHTTLPSGVRVDSELILSDSISLQSLSTYSARLVVNDFEKTKSLLLGQREIVVENTEETKESMTGSPFRYCATSDGFDLSSLGQDIFFGSNLERTVSTIFNRTRDGNSELFLTNANLSFATIEDAQAEINRLLQNLGISVAATPICYTIDYETLAAQCELYNEHLKGLRGASFEDITVQKSDECYFFVYQLTPLGLPVSTHENGVFGDGSWTSGTDVQVTYSVDGVVGLHMYYQFEDIREIGQSSAGLTVEQALNRLDQKYNSMILEGDYLVDNIEFEYVPIPDHGNSGSYTLLPAWRFSILHTYEVPGKENPNSTSEVNQRTTSVFNAITGEELVIDAGAT